MSVGLHTQELGGCEVVDAYTPCMALVLDTMRCEAFARSLLVHASMPVPAMEQKCTH